MDAVTLADLGFHWEANIFWKRVKPEGTVRVALARRRLDGSDLYDIEWSYTIDPEARRALASLVGALARQYPSWELTASPEVKEAMSIALRDGS